MTLSDPGLDNGYNTGYILRNCLNGCIVLLYELKSTNIIQYLQIEIKSVIYKTDKQTLLLTSRCKKCRKNLQEPGNKKQKSSYIPTIQSGARCVSFQDGDL